MAAAVKAAVQPALTALPLEADILNPDEIKATKPLPKDYVELRVSSRYGENRRASHTSGRRGYRILLRAVSVFEANTRVIYDAFDGALRDRFIAVDGRQVLVKFETATESDDDEGRASALASYTATT